MPTKLHRVQVLLQPEDEARMKTLAKAMNRTHSAMCAELIRKAMKQPKYKRKLKAAKAVVKAEPDPRNSQPQPWGGDDC